MGRSEARYWSSNRERSRQRGILSAEKRHKEISNILMSKIGIAVDMADSENTIDSITDTEAVTVEIGC